MPLYKNCIIHSEPCLIDYIFISDVKINVSVISRTAVLIGETVKYFNMTTGNKSTMVMNKYFQTSATSYAHYLWQIIYPFKASISHLIVHKTLPVT